MRKRILMFSLIALLVALLATTAYAYMFRRTQLVQNVFEPANVSCMVDEVFSGNTKSAITVENTGNTDAYIRVRLVFHWQDSKGNPVPRSFDLPTITPANGWISGGDGFTYYYPNPVKPGAFTPNLLANSVTMYGTSVESIKGGVYYYYYPVMEVVAEASQAKPAGAVESAWTVVGVNQDGNLYKKS